MSSITKGFYFIMRNGKPAWIIMLGNLPRSYTGQLLSFGMYLYLASLSMLTLECDVRCVLPPYFGPGFN